VNEHEHVHVTRGRARSLFHVAATSQGRPTSSQVRGLAIGVMLDAMSNALVKSSSSSSGGSGLVPAACSLVIPGVGQLINGETDKAIGVFVVAAATGAAFLGGLPLIGGVLGLVHLATHVYAVGDAYIQARRK
jgi:hypothetical protein